MVHKLLTSTFPVRSGEGRLTLALALNSLFAVGAFVAGRSVRDALFLAHADRSMLAWMYVGSAVAVALMGLFYNPIAARARRDKISVWTALLFSGLFVAFWRFEQGHQSWVYPALYIYVEVMGALVIVQFWTLCNEVFNAREAKRLYGLIGAGGVLSNVVIGLLTSRVALRLGASALLPVCAVLLVGAAGSSWMASRIARERLFARAATGQKGHSKRGGLARVVESPHLRSVAALAVVTFLTTTLVDYHFKVVAGDVYSKNELAAFFGRFYAVVGVLAFALQLFGTGRLLTWLGVIGSLAILPASLFLANVGTLVFRALWTASASKGADTLFRYSINDATTQILYLPVPPHIRAAAKAFIDGVVKPTSIALGGLALLAYRTFTSGSAHQLAWLTATLAAGWLVLVLAARRHYIRSLQDTLHNRRLDLSSLRFRAQDASTAWVMRRALKSEDTQEILGALEILPQLEGLHLDPEVEPLLDHALAEVRIAALEYFGKRQALRFANSVFRRFEDPEPQVRAAAVEVFCNLGRDKAVRSVRPHLSDAHPAVRAAAVTGIIRYGGLDGVLSAAEALKSLIGHADPEMRLHAAKILGAIGVRNFYQPVLELMADPALRVRREAIRAASLLRSPEFVLPLLYKTTSADVGAEAVDALSAYGPQIAPTLGKVLSNRLEDPAVRRGVARVLGRIATAEAVDVIARHLDDPDEEVRTRLYRSLARAVRAQRSVALDRKQVAAALERELRRAALCLAQAEALELGGGPDQKTPRAGPHAAAALLSSALAEQVALGERRIFLLLSVLYPDAAMERIYAGIRDAAEADAPRRRANAVELLDNLVDHSLRRCLLPLLDDCRRAEKLRMLSEVMELPRPTRDEAIADLCRDEAAWVRACAIYYATEIPFGGGTDALVVGVTDPSPIVREIALVGCARAAPDRADVLIRPRLADDAPFVRRRAELLTSRRT